MNEWIKTADKKPELGQAVIGVDEDGYVTRLNYIYYVGRPGFSDEEGRFSPEGEIIAWMPLPVYDGTSARPTSNSLGIKRMNVCCKTTDTFIDSLGTLFHILFITHNPVLPDGERIDLIQQEVESFLERHEEGKA